MPMASVAPPTMTPSTGGGALLDLLSLDVQQPAQPSTGGGGGDLGAGLLDLLGTSAPSGSGQ